MRFACALSREADTCRAIRLALEDLSCQLPEPCDFAAVHFTRDHYDSVHKIAALIEEQLHPRALIGCGSEGVVSGEKEVEKGPAISLIAAQLPGVELTSFHLEPGDWTPLSRDPHQLDVLARPRSDTRAILLIGDNATTPIPGVFRLMDELAPGAPLVGGLTDGRRPDGVPLVSRGHVACSGAAAVTFSGPVRIDAVLSRGCRPVGERFVVTRTRGGQIEAISGAPALEAARSALGRDRPRRTPRTVFLGVLADEYRSDPAPEDFLLHSLLRTDEVTGAITLDGKAETGQTVQFYVRDATWAEEELRLLMKRHSRGTPPAGAMLFTGSGRGTRMFGKPGTDAMAVHDATPLTPLSGFFTAAPFGVVAGKNRLHPHAASVLLFRELE